MKETRATRIRLAMTADQGRLIESAKRGDQEAFDELVRAHYRAVHTTAFRLLGNHEDAEDLAQECFVRAYRGLAWFRGEASFGSWLRRIVVHLARDRFRLAGRRPDIRPLAAALGKPAASGPLVEAGERELALLVSEAVRRLPESLRIALVLRTREGLSYEEIGRVSGVTPATARTQVMKARKELLRTLAPYLAQDGPEDRPDSRRTR